MDWMKNVLPTFEAIRKYASSGVCTPPPDVLHGAYLMAAPLLMLFMGREWFERHVASTSTKPGFLRTGPQNSLDTEIHMWRLIELAELLYNSAKISGFTQLVLRFRREKEIESIVAELRVARCLMRSGIPFQFVEPIRKKGCDYDLEVMVGNGQVSPADTKAKVEISSLSDSSIRSALEIARSHNLPKNRPGMIFLHVTQKWVVGTEGFADGRDGATLARVAHRLVEICDRVIPRFLQTTSRVAAVCVVRSPLIDFGGTAAQMLEIKQYSSAHHVQKGFPSDLFPWDKPGFAPQPWASLHEEGEPSRFAPYFRE